MRRLRPALLALLVAVPWPAPVFAPEAGVALRGTVRDQMGSPVAGALLSWGEWPTPARGVVWRSLGRATTGTDGTYQLENVTPGRIWLAGYKPGHRRLSRNLDMAAEPQELVLDLVMEKESYGRVRGRVLRPDGRPAVGLRVRSLAPFLVDPPPPASTDENGVFVFERFPAVRARVYVEVCEEPNRQPEFEVRPGVENVLPDIRLAPSGTVEVTARGLESLRPADRATLSLLPMIVAGSGRVVYPTDGMRLYLPFGHSLDPDPNRPAGAAYPFLNGTGGVGYCVLPSALGVDPALLRRPGNNKPPGPNGLVRFTRTRAGRSRVWASWHRDVRERQYFWMPLSTPFTVAEDQTTRVDLLVDGRESVSGHVRGPDGKGMARFLVAFQHSETMEDFGVCLTRDDGGFQGYALPPGEYHAVVWVPTLAAVRKPFSVRPGKTTELDVRLTRGASLRGSVIGRLPQRLYASAESDRGFGAAFVGPDGLFTLENLLPGVYTVRVWSPGDPRVVSCRNVVVAPGGDAEGSASVGLEWPESPP